MKKKRFVPLLALACAMTLAACGNVSTPSFSAPWSEGNIYEQVTYAVSRDRVTERNKENGEDVYTYETVATGTQTVTIRASAEFQNCLELIVDRALEYVKADEESETIKAEVGDRVTYRSRVVFSNASTTLMQTRYTEKRLTSDVDPRIDLDYTANYDHEKDGLTISDKKNDKEYRYKKGDIEGYYDNDLWFLMVRYGTNFGKGWQSDLQLISIADTIYNQDRTTALQRYTVAAKASGDGRNLQLPALKENIVLSDTDSVAKVENDMFYAPAVDVSIAQSGGFGANKGPIIHASFSTDRLVSRKVPLANLLLAYEQDEYLPSGVQTHRNTLNITGASITESV